MSEWQLVNSDAKYPGDVGFGVGRRGGAAFGPASAAQAEPDVARAEDSDGVTGYRTGSASDSSGSSNTHIALARQPPRLVDPDSGGSDGSSNTRYSRIGQPRRRPPAARPRARPPGRRKQFRPIPEQPAAGAGGQDPVWQAEFKDLQQRLADELGLLNRKFDNLALRQPAPPVQGAGAAGGAQEAQHERPARPRRFHPGPEGLPFVPYGSQLDKQLAYLIRNSGSSLPHRDETIRQARQQEAGPLGQAPRTPPPAFRAFYEVLQDFTALVAGRAGRNANSLMIPYESLLPRQIEERIMGTNTTLRNAVAPSDNLDFWRIQPLLESQYYAYLTEVVTQIRWQAGGRTPVPATRHSPLIWFMTTVGVREQLAKWVGIKLRMAPAFSGRVWSRDSNYAANNTGMLAAQQFFLHYG